MLVLKLVVLFVGEMWLCMVMVDVVMLFCYLVLIFNGYCIYYDCCYVM